MKIAFVGCGYVFDIYMRTRWAYPELTICGIFDIDTARSATVARHYGLHVYPSYDALLADPQVDLVINLTSVRSHYETTKRALETGKHVYSEKPLTTDLERTRELFALAEAKKVVLTGAPCNIYCDAVNTLWKAIRDGAIGKPLLVYAELDDNPAHLMNLERVQSPTGAPFPYVEELQTGCTMEHVAYHLVWLCAMFGPAQSVTAYSKCLIPQKTQAPLSPPDTPDFSVACITFANGVAARITCSWVAPRDHRFRVIGELGEVSVDNIFHDQSPVRLERFSRVSLAARKIHTLRTHAALGRLFNIGGRKVPLVRRWKSHAVEAERGVGRSLKHRFVSWLRRREVYATDKLLGIAEAARAIEQGRPQPLSPDFMLHLSELTLMIHAAGPTGATLEPTTTFRPMSPFADVANNARDYNSIGQRPRTLERMLVGAIDALHKR
jgi:predicted dehydrogenase